MKKEGIAKILLIIGILSLFLIPSTYSLLRNAGHGDSTVALANWSVTLNDGGDNNYLSIVPDPENINDTYTLHITSNSEVDVIYSIIIDNLPSGVSVKADSGNFVSESNHKVLLNNVGVIRYNDANKTKDCILTFKASTGATYVDEQQVSISVILSQQIPS